MREQVISRQTNETNIEVVLNLDEKKPAVINTGIGFLDHMLELLSRHSGFTLGVTASGDLGVDTHHTAEDIGIALGTALSSALGDKRGIARYSAQFVPMDEALARVCVDISGRSYLVFDVSFSREFLGSLETECVEEFFRAFADNAHITLHISSLYGKNNHHICEAVFKATARALRYACAIESDEIPSTKGVL